MRCFSYFWLCVGLLVLGACSGGWFGDSDDEKKLEGERIPVLSSRDTLQANDALADAKLSLPEAEVPAQWPQAGGRATHLGGNVATAEGLTQIADVQAGDGEPWDGPLIPAPVLSENAVFVMDAVGDVSAHSRRDMTDVLWQAKIGEEEEEALAGGGLTFAGDVLYAATPVGKVVALQAGDGKVRWSRELKAPLRSAPIVESGVLLVVTADSQLFALDAASGGILWQHRGIRESASLLGSVIPAVAQDTVIVPYASGEVYALGLHQGEALWSDSLLLPQRTVALGSFTGAGGNPVIDGSLVFNVSHNGLIAVNDLRTGVRVWERAFSSANAPWVAGDFVFALASDGQLVAFYKYDGRIAWISQVPHENDTTLHLTGPYLINSRVYVFASDGTLYGFSPTTGALEDERDFISVPLSAPAFAGGIMYVLGQNATLYAVR